ncbi:TetR/AcrR family transcriptional regulator [Glaciimonas sp. PCH181]|uniref:TetR/AcrR family transcriptional regulator n=1 Tax=Glaciimonas sp. PCH181 TaxID=2133943 RepID=UPI000D3A0BE1|nr:TetR/AcrR family transcriptional regulator [Glaciimonas sp. PCH181]PUA17724.1 TetR/AcrR family transcriptional regulator [Glaciimonas sp. PCH181]
MLKTKESGKRFTRAEKSVQVRQNLLEAAMDIIGKYGYADASIAKITDLANVAQGTFYNYFESRDDILNQVLVAMGEMMLDFISGEVTAEDAIEREMQRFDAFFKFLLKKPQFYRVLNEAQIFAPEGYKKHFENITGNYKSTLRRAHKNGNIKGYDENELDAIVAILMGIRASLGQEYAYSDGKVRPIPSFVRDAYRKLIERGIFT